MELKTIPIDQAKNPKLPPSKNAIELYAHLKQDFSEGQATEIAFGKNQWGRLKSDVIDMADADDLYVYVNKAAGYNMKRIWLEPKNGEVK